MNFLLSCGVEDNVWWKSPQSKQISLSYQVTSLFINLTRKTKHKLYKKFLHVNRYVFSIPFLYYLLYGQNPWIILSFMECSSCLVFPCSSEQDFPSVSQRYCFSLFTDCFHHEKQCKLEHKRVSPICLLAM